MSAIGRKGVVWSIKKKLHQLTAKETYQIATSLGDVQGLDSTQLSQDDEESCVEYLTTYLTCPAILEREDQGLPLLKRLENIIDGAIVSRSRGPVLDETEARSGELAAHPSQPLASTSDTDVQTLLARCDDIQSQLNQALSAAGPPNPGIPFQFPASSHSIPQQAPQSPAPQATGGLPISACVLTQQLASPQHSFMYSQNVPSCTGESMIAMKDLPLLSHKEFKIHGGMISDTTAEVSYHSICKQIDEGLKEKHTPNEIIRGVLRAIKPGNFRDMLTVKDGLTVTELKSFLQSHLGEKSSTELFQDLMCAKQHDNETPQQFLYRMIGLKQKILFSLKQPDSVVKYDMPTIQCIFLNTICQGIGERYESVRRDLKTLLGDPAVSDEALLRQVIKTTTEESERKRRLGRSSTPKVSHAHAANTEHKEKSKDDIKVSHTDKDSTIQRLSAQVEALTQAMESLKAFTAQVTMPARKDSLLKPQTERRVQRPKSCENCASQGNPTCHHCFACGEEGHRAVGCLKRNKPSGNWRRSGQRD
uniref:uncharacterized protein LOC109951150 n=1 Tax=Monopterus albus TaxID=43700 RepID=UPI0009B40810|nr:uncharacterized protein LOC109951150 [Monopterus albus]XP_020441121.1 uncharacterized protein LOC109951150 [Monopterus albus]